MVTNNNALNLFFSAEAAANQTEAKGGLIRWTSGSDFLFDTQDVGTNFLEMLRRDDYSLLRKLQVIDSEAEEAEAESFIQNISSVRARENGVVTSYSGSALAELTLKEGVEYVITRTNDSKAEQ